MNKILSSVVLLLATSTANATLIQFESGLDPLFTYTGVDEYHAVTAGSGYEAMASFTGTNNWVIDPYEANPSTFTWAGTGTFTLNSFAIAGAWGSQTLKIESLLNNAVLNTVMFAVDNTAVDIFNPGWSGINAFRITLGTDYVADPSLFGLGAGQHWVLDNLSINSNINAVPLPAAAFMFAPALLGFLGLRRKAKKSIA